MNQDQITGLQQALALSTSNQTTDGILVAALTIAVSLAQNGYQSDAETISAGIASGLSAATDPLNTQIASLTTQLESTQALLPAFQAQIQTILADGTGSDNQIQEITALLAG